MEWMRRGLLVLTLVIAACRPTQSTQPARAVRVCSETANMPFSNGRGEGFDDHITELLAEDLGVEVQHTFLNGVVAKDAVEAEGCDLVLGLPPRLGILPSTRPYYRASWVFVTRTSVGAPVRTFDDPRLRTLRVGVPVLGHAIPLPPAHALERRGIVANVRGFPMLPDDADDPPQFAPLRALAAGEIDVAIVWGPHAGFFVHDGSFAIANTPESDDGVPLASDVAIGARAPELLAQVDSFLVRRKPDIDAILHSYGVR